jgi:asparagine synthase (glutamine-hydrolysing)
LAELVKKSGTTVVQVGEGADENFLGYWWCEHYRKKYEQIYRPALNDSLGVLKSALGAFSAEDSEIIDRARNRQELFWGGAACWWGKLRHGLTPDPVVFQQSLSCPVSGLLPAAFETTDSHAVVSHYLGSLSGNLASPEVLQKISYMEMKLRLPEHLLMRVDKLTMAHSVEARAPFLDHDLVDFAHRLPLEYKLRGGVGKWLLKKAAEPYLDHDMIYRTKQGFGAPMDQWFRDPEFGSRCLTAFRRSELTKEGFFDTEFFESMLLETMAGRGGYSFQVWTVLNAVMWHASWVEGREDCL